MPQIPHADEGRICPLHKQDMSKVCHRCPLWVLIRGKHPQSNDEIDHWNCALAWLPVLMIENSQQQRGTAAAVESFRNEVAKASQSSNETLAALMSLAPPAPSNNSRMIEGR